jgi:beta-lactam-binding protein with PASTA domain/uncharacterized lipoprotein YbaY
MGSSVDRRRLTAISVVAFLALLLAIPLGVFAQTTSTTFVTGSITTKDPISLSDGAVAVVTIVDRSARGDGVIVGLQRKIDLGGTTPVTFKVRYDPKRIDASHSYVAFAAIIDGAKRWQNTDGVPVITGGPTSDVDIRVKKVGDNPPASIEGELTKKDKTALSGKAVALAAVLDVDTGRTISWTAITPSGDVPIPFSLGFDPSTVDPGATLVGWGAIVDKGSVWEADGGSPIIAAGSNLSTGSILVIPTTPLPVAPSPTPQPTPVTIPAVKNQPESQAKQTLKDADLVVGSTNKVFNANVKSGNAIKTKPEAGNKVAPQTSVTLVVSKGPSPSPSPTPKPTAKPTPKPTAKPTPTPTAKPTPTPVTVPDVRGQTEADAVISITDVGLKVGQRIRRFNDKVAAGDALKTDPAKGTKVKPGTALDLYISKGPSPSPSPTPSPTAKPTPSPSPTTVVVPKTKGMTEADAVVEMTDAGLRIGDRIRRSNADIPAGSVIKSDPSGGTSVPSGTRVDLYISTGPSATPTPKPVTVPDVRGMAEADAIIALTDAGLEIGQRFRQLDPDLPAGDVIDTDPGPKSKVTPGTFVDLFVSNGPAPTPVPTPSPTPTPSPSPSPEPSGSPIPWPYPSEGPGFLSGALVYRDQAEPGPFRQVVITLLEESGVGSRVVPTTQYVAEGSAPLGFALSFDWAQIRPDATYRVLAAIVDGEQSWFSDQGAAAITGGAPINGLLVPLFLRGDILEGQVSGVIVGVDQDLSADAVREAFLIRNDTGEVVAFDTAPASTETRAQAFAVPFLLSDIDQAAEYVIVTRVIDGPRIWTGPGVPVVTNGNPFRVVVQVSAVTGTQPMLDTPGS